MPIENNSQIPSNSIPIEIRRIKDETSSGIGIEIKWSSGESIHLSSLTLRKNCPCASCLEKRGISSHAQPLATRKSSLRVLTATADEESNLIEIWPVGNYALGISWGDKHDTGIYSFNFLKQLFSQEKETSK